MTKSSAPQRAGDPSSQGSRPAVGVNKGLLIGLAVFIAAVVAVFVFRAYHMNTYVIPSASMEPGLQVGDRIEIDPTAYEQAPPQRGDVVVFDGAGSFYPYESETPTKRFFDAALQLLGMAPQHNAVVKRIIGVPGDTVECCDDNGRLMVNDGSLDEPYLAEPDLSASSTPFLVEVPDNRVFLLGDNRYDSIDSRALLGAPGGGMIQKNKIYGPVISTR
ncbi:signal peptidase I [Enteractinococcus coprophilus]|uniref:Signal peptidase I n=1 Tax=Enteractinococcus coprophilus TaxID=1027633 RepID=A0A543AIP7_9MICC|nr:signal peptidase I [Enteractinococcus coprophilus]TQL72441.1 signal peptidase I [Enteractinococcus coprophilus]